MKKRDIIERQILLGAKEAAFSNEELSAVQADAVIKGATSAVDSCRALAAATMCCDEEHEKRKKGLNKLLELCQEDQSHDDFSLAVMREILMRLISPFRREMYRSEFLSFIIRTSHLKSSYGRANVPLILRAYATGGDIKAIKEQAIAKLKELVDDAQLSVRNNAKISLAGLKSHES